MPTVERLTAEPEWRAFYPVVADFWPVEDADEHVSHLREMTDQGYRAFGRYDDEPVSFAGVFVLHCPWYDDFAWLLDLVTRPDRRGEGHGSALYEAVETWARDEGCDTVVLASGIDRKRTHAFYERHGFDLTEYWFEKSIGTGERV